jgi:hypothetical protein
MRYIRFFVILFLLVFFLPHRGPIYAVDSLFSVSGCDDLTKPCLTTGDGVNTVIELTQTEIKTSNIIGELVGKDIQINWLGILTPLGDIYRNANKKLDTMGSQIQTASDMDLNPAALQTVEQHDESSKAATMTSRVCVEDPQTGEMKSAVSKTTILSADQPWLRLQGEGARRLSSFTTGYTQESQDFRLPDTAIKEDAALPCGSAVEGKEKPQQNAPSQFANDYTGSGSILGEFLYRILDFMIKPLYNSQGSPSGEQATVTATGTIVGTAQNPYAGHANALTAGCASSSDLNDVSYATDEQKKKLCATGGFVNSMYRPDAIDATYKFDLDAKDPNQQWDYNIIKTQSQADLSNAFTGRMEAAGDYMNCTLMPAGYQSTAVPGGECNTNWAGAPTASCDSTLENLKLDPSKYNSFGNGNDATLGFSIPMHNTACKISNLAAVADFAAQWINGRPEAAQARANVLANYATIEKFAVKAGWNPAFLVALWIEETAAGGLGGPQMGCVFDFGINGSADPSVCGQLACVANYPPRNSTYDFLCSYGGKGGVGCTTFYINAANDNRCFPSNLRGSYQEVVNRGGVGTGCAPVGKTSDLFRKDCEARVPGGSIFDK